MTMRRAADFRVKIDGNFYSIRGIQLSSRSQADDVSNTEGVPGNEEYLQVLGFVSKIPDLRQGQVRFTSASFDDANNPYAAPIQIIDGEYYAVTIYPAGIGGPSYSWGNVLCTEVSHQGTIPGPQPVDITFETDGTYRLASS